MTASRKPLRRRCGHCSPPSASSWWPRTGSGRGPQSSSRAAAKLRPPRHHSRPAKAPGEGTPGEGTPGEGLQAARPGRRDRAVAVSGQDGQRQAARRGRGGHRHDLPTPRPRPPPPSLPFQRGSPRFPAEADPAPSGYTPTEPVPAVPAVPAVPVLPPASAEEALPARRRCRTPCPCTHRPSPPFPPHQPSPPYPQHQPSPPFPPHQPSPPYPQHQPTLPGRSCLSPTTTSFLWLRCGRGCACWMRPRCTPCSTTRRHTRAGRRDHHVRAPSRQAERRQLTPAHPAARIRRSHRPWRSTHRPRHQSRSAPSSG